MNEPSHILAELGGKVMLVEPAALRTIAARLARISAAPPQGEAAAHFQAWWDDEEKSRALYEVDAEGVACIPIRGLIMKSVPPLWQYYGDLYGWAFTGCEETRERITAAALDGRVKSIRLEVDSPGGGIDSLQALADDVYAARELKPVEACVEGMMASAALWIGSQASHIRAGKTSEIGSVGVFAIMSDYSQMAAGLGIKVHVISNAPGKGWADGAPIPPEQIANVQSLVTGLTAQFVEALARGLGLELAAAMALATGEVWLGEEARMRGLVHAVGPDRKALNQAGPQASTEDPMSKEALEKALAETAAARAETEKAKAETSAARADADKAKAEAEGYRAVIEQLRKASREELLQKYGDRVPAGARDAIMKAVVAYADDMKGAEEYLKALPVYTRRDAIGGAPPLGQEGADAVDPQKLATQAQSYQAAEAAKGRRVSITEAVNAVRGGAGG